MQLASASVAAAGGVRIPYAVAGCCDAAYKLNVLLLSISLERRSLARRPELWGKDITPLLPLTPALDQAVSATCARTYTAYPLFERDRKSVV